MADIYVHRNEFDATRLKLFDGLCSDVILELDFDSHLQRFIFQFDGESPDSSVSNDEPHFLGATATKEVSLFSNLSRRYPTNRHEVLKIQSRRSKVYSESC